MNVRGIVKKKPMVFRPSLEILEGRVVPATRVWDGGGIDANWMTAANWSGDLAPTAGDDLIFPAGAARTTNTNTFPSGTSFASLTLTGNNYSISGNSVFISGVLLSAQPLGTNTFAAPLMLGPGTSLSTLFQGATLNVTSAVSNNGNTLTVGGSGTTSLSGVVSGSGGVLKRGVGRMDLSGTNTYGGVTTVQEGILGVTGFGTPLGAATAGTTVLAGATLSTSGIVTIAEPLILNGAGIGGAAPFGNGGALTGMGFATFTGGITLGSNATIGYPSVASITISTMPVTLNGATLTLNTLTGNTGSSQLVFNTPIVDGTGPGSLVVNRSATTGQVTLTGANTYSGSTTVFAGTLSLTGGGTLVSTGITIWGNAMSTNGPAPGILQIDNVSTNLTNRIPDNATLTLLGGAFSFQGNNTAPSSTERIGVLALPRGHSGLRVLTGTGTTTTSTVTFGSLSRSVGATIDFTGPLLGTARNRLLFDAAPTTVGNSGGILPYATYTTISSPTGPTTAIDYATYDATVGVRAYTAYATNLSTALAGDIVRVTGVAPLTGNKTITALALSGGATVNLSSGVTLTTGGILSAGPTSATLSGGTVAFSGEGVLLRNNASFNSFTVSSVLTGTSGLTLSGTGELKLSPPAPGNSYTGGTRLNSAPVTLVSNNAPFGGAAGGTIDAFGGTLQVDVFLGNVTIPNAIMLNNGFLTFGGLPQITFSGAITLTGQNVLNVPLNPPVVLSGAMSGNGSLIVTNSARLTISPTSGNTFSGGTTLANLSVFAPTVTLGHAQALGTGPLTIVQGTIQATSPFTVTNELRLGNSSLSLAGTSSLTLSGPTTAEGLSTLTTSINSTLSGALNGSGAITKAGTAALTLTSNSGLQGATLINAGTLVINGSLNTSAVAVNGGTLGGTGSVGRLATSGTGLVAPGAAGTGLGTLGSGTVDLAGGGSVRIQVSGYSTPGVDYDRLDLTSAPVILGGTSKLTVDLAGVTTPGIAASVIRYSGRIGAIPTFTTVEVVNNPNNFPVVLDYQPTGLNLQIGDATPPSVSDVIIRWGTRSASLTTLLSSGRSILPFLNIQSVDVVFSEDVAVQQASLALSGLAGAYGISTFSYQAATATARWTLATTLGGATGIDRLLLALSGAGATGVRDRAGNALAGGVFQRSFSVLVGDITGDGVVDLADQLAARSAFVTSYAGVNLADLDGNGRVDLVDYQIARARRLNRLP